MSHFDQQILGILLILPANARTHLCRVPVTFCRTDCLGGCSGSSSTVLYHQIWGTSTVLVDDAVRFRPMSLHGVPPDFRIAVEMRGV